MKNKFNTLRRYILDYSVKKYRQETVDGLFRSIIEPLLSNQNIQACILLKLDNIDGKESLLKRLSFSSGNLIYSYNDKLINSNYQNEQRDNIWDTTEFAIVLGQRYSAALIWDYELSEKTQYTDACLLYNSKIISDIAKKISENSKVDIKEFIQKYSPDRRENKILNQSVSLIAALLNDKVEENISNENEKNMSTSDDILKTAESVAQKAKFIAHEIKNNLSIINLYSAIAEKRIAVLDTDGEIMDSIKNAVKNISTASENVSYLIGDLRCLSAPYMTEINIRHIILNTVMICSAKAERAGVKIIVNDFPDFILTSDKTKFQCALTNIIFNAIEACKKSCTIWIDSLTENNFLKVYIKNNGAMIPDNIKDKIFEPDFTTKIKGSGLGLDICRKQLELTGGNIKLISSNKSETVFVISLPV